MSILDEDMGAARRERRGIAVVLVLFAALVLVTLQWAIPHEGEDLYERSLYALRQAGMDTGTLRVEFSGRDATLYSENLTPAELEYAGSVVQQVAGVRRVMTPTSGHQGETNIASTAVTQPPPPLPVAPPSAIPEREVEALASAHGPPIATPAAGPGPEGEATAPSDAATTRLARLAPALQHSPGVEPEPVTAPDRPGAGTPAAQTALPKVTPPPGKPSGPDATLAIPTPIPTTPAAGQTVRTQELTLFSPGSSLLTGAAYRRLEEIAARLRAEPSTRREIDIYTQDSGNPYFNTLLSQLRANVVVMTLLHYGIHPSRVIVRSYVRQNLDQPGTSPAE